MPTRILFLYSDTGGGHRSAAEAIRDAIDLTWPGRAEADLADFYVEAFPPPFNRTGALYGPMVNHAGWLWHALWAGGDLPGMRDAMWRVSLPTMRGRFRALLHRHTPDVVVSVHPLACRPMALAAHALKPPIPALTVVTDLVEGSSFWFDPYVDFTYVPTDAARAKALRWGLPPDRVEVVGQPVHPRFIRFSGDRADLRRRLGLRPDLTTVLVVGGGEGMGNVYGIAEAIDGSGLPLQLAVIAGRNTRLKERLDAHPWRVPTVVTGFVTNMPEWMAAADVLVTKAGPGTISEALIAGLPLILSGYVPGQEETNLTWVVDKGVGAAALTPDAVVHTLRDWLTTDNGIIPQMAERAAVLARPTAARDLGARILLWAERQPIVPTPLSPPSP
jgi:1,2-diacylglycerol 3-beta-galactosyltransferase